MIHRDDIVTAPNHRLLGRVSHLLGRSGFCIVTWPTAPATITCERIDRLTVVWTSRQIQRVEDIA